ncbi:hypothetical protein DHEL01_v207532 [Diaporthe helianthi]|uniref:Uncharacterized protein n=1 Tax=Diaporthe helianthi TaxID=158607 RepID=A0A2P5HV09_DIAHE|nr:hypothetical protein DHEL01_v207532 [Diaporthe helianthi]
MAQQYSSTFRYTIERTYPFRWFTPLVTVCGAAALALFTFINIAADGYVQSVIYTTNPNSTLEEEHWYMNAPWSWISTARTSCQSPGLAIGIPYYTSNQQTGSYTVTMMNTTLGPDDEGVYPGLDYKTLGTTTYLNNTLYDCEMGDLMVIFTSQQQPSSSKLQVQSGPIYCKFDAAIPVNITIEQSFSGIEFLFEQRSSLSQWTVYDFMQSSFNVLMSEIHGLNSTIEYTGTTLSLKKAESEDITADDFFSTTILSPGQSESLVAASNSSQNDEPFPLAQGDPGSIARLLDAFAKSYYSVVIWDLNFNRSTNAFASRAAMDYLVNTIADATGNDTMTTSPILGSSDLVGNHARFEMQYICSVPQKKDLGSLIISVVVANIVLLCVFWNIFNWVALRYLRARDPTWDMCRGCILHSEAARNNARGVFMDLEKDPLCQNDEGVQEAPPYESRQDQRRGQQVWKKPRSWSESTPVKSSQSSLRTFICGEEGHVRKNSDDISGWDEKFPAVPGR